MSEIVFNSLPPETSLQSQVLSFQTTLALLNQQVITLQEALQERDQEIAELEMKLGNYPLAVPESDNIPVPEMQPHTDNTLTLVGLLINLYKFAFQPGKDSSAPVRA